MKKIAASLATTLLFAVAVPALAQDSGAILQIERGSAMTSSGGEFVTVNSGASVSSGQRLMLPENSAVTLVYGNGCNRRYTAPGVYVIEPACVAGTVADGPVDWRSAGIITGGVLIGAAILANMDENHPPISR